MDNFNLTIAIQGFLYDLMGKAEAYIPIISGAFFVLGVGILLSLGTHLFVLYLFKKFKLIQFIDRFTKEEKKNKQGEVKVSKLSDKVKVDEIIAKSLAYYIFLVFFRLAIVVIGIEEVENFLADLLAYLPSLFIGIIIGFFGIRFGNFIYDIVYQTLHLSKQKTAKIIASGAKIIILFFTLMLVLKYIKIVDTFIINTILVGFISMLTIAGGLAFGLGGRDIAKEILESFRK